MLILILILLEIYFPSILYKSFNINPAFFLLLIIFITFRYGRTKGILIAFLFGFIIDILIQSSLFGFIVLLTCIFSYLIGFLIKINDIRIKYTVSVLLSLVYFYFYYFVQFSTSFIVYVELSFMKTLLTVITYYLINLFFSKRYQFFEKQF